MNTDTITIKYDWKHSSMAHLGCQCDGAMCENIEWSQERGTVETWRIGEFDPSIYPGLEKTPFQIWQNTTDKQHTAEGGSDAPTCSAMVAALIEVLPHHTLSCVSRLNLHNKPWSFDVSANGKPLITPESCKCGTYIKYLRGSLPIGHAKGFSQNANMEAPNA